MKTDSKIYHKQYQLSWDLKGHCLHHTKCFSPNDEWIVYDSRNTDSSIGSTGNISLINTFTKEEKIIYETKNQTEHGPGAGAVSFSPLRNEIVFIHGIRNSNKKNPYAFNRRSGVKINLADASKLILLDARNIIAPFTPGALRGGTHSHLWDEKGDWISFTYDDFIMDELSRENPESLFKRTVGVMTPDLSVIINEDLSDHENHNGEMFSFIIAKTTSQPRKGSDDIDTAFDETWIGKDGYLKANGYQQRRAVAFQGKVIDFCGKIKTELFVVDLPDYFEKHEFSNTKGTKLTPPTAPERIRQRRLTYLERGINAPRHWLRSLPDGSEILFLNQDADGVVQLFSVDTNGGEPRQISKDKKSIEGPFNISPDGKYAAYICENEVVICSLHDGKTIFIPSPPDFRSKAVGAVTWSNSGKKLAYNRFVSQKSEDFLQIFIIELDTDLF